MIQKNAGIIGNGLDLPPLEAIPAKTNNDWIDIGAIVRFAQIKDIKTMIYTFSQLKQEIPNTRLHILGGIDDQQYYQECLDLIDYLKVEEILILGSVNILEYLEQIDFTILTSLSEGTALRHPGIHGRKEASHLHRCRFMSRTH